MHWIVTDTAMLVDNEQLHVFAWKSGRACLLFATVSWRSSLVVLSRPDSLVHVNDIEDLALLRWGPLPLVVPGFVGA